MNAGPVLTIAIPTLNGDRFLEEAVHSVACELVDVEHVELLILDNASTDQTARVCEDLLKRYPFIRYERNSKTLPVNENILAAISRARGQYVWLLADDDVIVPGAVSEVVDNLTRINPALLLVNFITVSVDLSPLNNFEAIDPDLSILDLGRGPKAIGVDAYNTTEIFDECDQALVGTGFSVFGLLSAIIVHRDTYLTASSNLDPPVPSGFDFLYLIPLAMRTGVTVFIRRPMVLFRQYEKRWVETDDYSQAMDNYFVVIPHILQRLGNSGFDRGVIRRLLRRNLRNFALHVAIAKSKGMPFSRQLMEDLIRTNFRSLTFWLQLPAILVPRTILVHMSKVYRIRRLVLQRAQRV